MLPVVTPKQKGISLKVQYSENMPSNKMQGKDWHMNDVQYKFGIDDDLINLSYHQILE